MLRLTHWSHGLPRLHLSLCQVKNMINTTTWHLGLFCALRGERSTLNGLKCRQRVRRGIKKLPGAYFFSRHVWQLYRIRFRRLFTDSFVVDDPAPLPPGSETVDEPLPSDFTPDSPGCDMSR